MRKYLIVMVAAMLGVICLSSVVRADNADFRAQRQQLRQQQKLESNSLKVQQRNIKQSWKLGRVSSVQRNEMNHQMQRSSRDLKQKQKDSMQDLKDRQKALRSMQRVNGQ